MPRYIDADDAIYELERAFPADDYGKIIRCISRTPTADVVEVVRCEYCKHRIVDSNDDWCECTGCDINPDGFCEEGERGEDAEVH